MLPHLRFGAVEEIHAYLIDTENLVSSIIAENRDYFAVPAVDPSEDTKPTRSLISLRARGKEHESEFIRHKLIANVLFGPAAVDEFCRLFKNTINLRYELDPDDPNPLTGEGADALRCQCKLNKWIKYLRSPGWIPDAPARASDLIAIISAAIDNGNHAQGARSLGAPHLSPAQYISVSNSSFFGGTAIGSAHANCSTEIALNPKTHREALQAVEDATDRGEISADAFVIIKTILDDALKQSAVTVIKRLLTDLHNLCAPLAKRLATIFAPLETFPSI